MTAIHVTGPHEIRGVTRYKVAIRDGDGLVVEDRRPLFWTEPTYLRAYALAHNIARDRRLPVIDEAAEIMP